MKRETNKQRVLNQFPKAICAEYKPGHFWVALDGNAALLTQENSQAPDAQKVIGGNPGSAWSKMARFLGERNAIETNSPFILNSGNVKSVS